MLARRATPEITRRYLFQLSTIAIFSGFCWPLPPYALGISAISLGIGRFRLQLVPPQPSRTARDKASPGPCILLQLNARSSVSLSATFYSVGLATQAISLDPTRTKKGARCHPIEEIPTAAGVHTVSDLLFHFPSPSAAFPSVLVRHIGQSE